MSISTRITSMINNIKNAYHGLESVGLDTSNIDKNIENISAVLDDFYASLPKVSGSGSNIQLTPTKKGRITSQINGDTFQQTYTGKNLFDGQIELGGIDDSTGQPYNNNNALRSKNYIEVQSNTIYTFSNNKNYHMRIYEYNSNKEIIQMISTLFQGTATFTTTTNTKYIKFRTISSPAENDLTSLWQLEIGSTATTYEPYVGGIASPNPLYPQNIQSVTGTQNINVCGKNLFDKNNIKVGYRFGSTGDYYPNTGYNATDYYISVKPNTTYATSWSISQMECVCLYDKNKNFISRLSTGNYSFTTTNETYFIRADVKDANLETAQIELGSTVTTYEAFSGEVYPINLGKNLFDGEYKNLALWSTTANVNTTFAGNNNNYVGAYIKVESGETYSISRAIETNRFTVSFSIDEPKGGGATLVYNTGTGKKFENITVPNGYNYLFVYLSNSGEDTTNLDLQIEKGTQATSYSPYFTPIELFSGDTITGTPNNWSILKNVGKYILDSTKNWYATGTGNKDYQVTLGGNDRIYLKQSATGYSNYFRVSNSGSDVFMWPILQGSTDYIRIVNAIDKWETVDDFKTFITNNTVELIFPLATPTTTPITDTTLINDLNNFYYAMSKNGETNISVDGSLPIILDVSALKGEE